MAPTNPSHGKDPQTISLWWCSTKSHGGIVTAASSTMANWLQDLPFAACYECHSWFPTNRSRTSQNSGANRNFGSWARIRRHVETTNHSWKLMSVLVKKIGSRDSIFGLVNSTFFQKIINHNQHAFNMKYLANLTKKYWTCFRYQKLAENRVCFPPSVHVQVGWLPSWNLPSDICPLYIFRLIYSTQSCESLIRHLGHWKCLMYPMIFMNTGIQLSFGFWGRAVKAHDNFSRKLARLSKTIF